ncbi:MAG: STAS domain-containing protein [Bacillota bacterium]
MIQRNSRRSFCQCPFAITIAGVDLSAIFFVAKISKIKVEKKLLEATHYQVQGQLFFASVDDFLDKFDFSVEDKGIVIDFTDAHIWDDSGVGLDTGSQKLIDQLAIFKSDHAKLPTH